MMLRVEELMTPGVISLRQADSLETAEKTMQGSDIRHLPVVDEGNHVVGILSDRDILRALARRNNRATHVGELMSRDVVTVRPEAPAYRAAELMLERKIGCLPVVDDTEALVGIVTETDLLAVAHQALHGRTGAQLLQV